MHRGLIAVVSVLLACGGESPPPPQASQTLEQSLTASPASTPTDSVLAELENIVSRLGHSRQELRAKLGSPLRHSVIAAENAVGEIDTLITLRYPGLEIILRKSVRDSAEYLSNVRALDSSFALPHGLQLFRTSEATVRGLVGTPSDTQAFGDTTVAGYETKDGLVIQFYYPRSRLVRLRWVYDRG